MDRSTQSHASTVPHRLPPPAPGTALCQYRILAYDGRPLLSKSLNPARAAKQLADAPSGQRRRQEKGSAVLFCKLQALSGQDLEMGGVQHEDRLYADKEDQAIRHEAAEARHPGTVDASRQ
jgi:hypothetical protein